MHIHLVFTMPAMIMHLRVVSSLMASIFGDVLAKCATLITTTLWLATDAIDVTSEGQGC